jgi:hypothetical protein
VSPVKYELGFISQKTTFFIVTAVKTSNLTWNDIIKIDLQTGGGVIHVATCKDLCRAVVNTVLNTQGATCYEL